MSKPSACCREIACSATRLCMSARNAASAAAPFCCAAAPAAAKASLSRATGAVAPMIACFSVLSAVSAPPISAPSLICTSSATGHLNTKRGAAAPREKPAAGSRRLLTQFDRGKLRALCGTRRIGAAAPLHEAGKGEADAAAIGHRGGVQQDAVEPVEAAEILLLAGDARLYRILEKPVEAKLVEGRATPADEAPGEVVEPAGVIGRL